jgi:hypothetical protein
MMKIQLKKEIFEPQDKIPPSTGEDRHEKI